MARTFRTRVITAVVVVATSATLAGVASPASAASGTYTQPGTIAVPDQYAARQSGSITINDATTGVAPASPYPATVTTSGLVGTIADVDVRLLGFTHSYPDDVDVMLVGPNGAKVIVFSDSGAGTDVSGVDLTLDDDVVFPVPDENEALLTTDRWRPANYEGGDTFPAPAPDPAGAGSSLSAFDGADPNGTWSLYVVDDAGSDSGSLTSGFQIIVQLAPAATPYPSTLTVSGAAKGVTDVNVVLRGLTHTASQDLDLMLVGPGGQRTLIMSDAGAGAAGVNVVLDDEAGPLLPETPTDIVSGTYRPTNYNYPGQSGDNFQPPAPILPLTAANLGVFDGTDPNGTWALYAVDDAIADTGGLADGWSLQITTVDPPAAPTLTSPVSGTVNSTGVVTFAGTATPGVAVRVTDGGTEVASTLASGSGAWTASLTGVATGSHSYRAVVTDTFGNSSPSPAATVMVDTASPSGSVLVNNGALRTRTPRVTLSLPATDLGSGVTEMRLSNDGVTWSGFETYAATRPWAFTAANGTKTVRVQFRDAAGNVSSAVSDSIVLDSVAPKVSTTKPGAGASGVTRSMTVVAVASERLSSATVLRATAYLTKSGSSTKVRAKVTYDAATRTIRINPRRDLARRTTYVATITTAVKDAAGNFLDQQSRRGLQPKRWSFTTR